MSSSSSSGTSEDEDHHTIAEDLVVTKYKMAGDITNRVLEQVLAKCVEDASAREICVFGDNLIAAETNKVFRRNKELSKGIAFPTCVSVNNCMANFSPLTSQPDCVLKEGDVVKVELGSHIDGFMAFVAHTVVVGASAGKRVTGKRADVVVAAHQASQAALRLVRPGEDASTVTDIVHRTAEEYGCKPVQGLLSYRLKQFKVDQSKVILQNPTELQKKEVDTYRFSIFDVFAVEVIFSTGEAIPKDIGTKETIFRKTGVAYQLKSRASRAFYSEMSRKFGSMAFHIRNFDDEKIAKLGVVECVNHEVVKPYKVYYDKPGEFVAYFKFTVLLMPSGAHKITGLPFETDVYHSEFGIRDPHLKTILSMSVNRNTIKKKKKKLGIYANYAYEVASDS